MISAGINGFGRFGLHLLKYWIDRVDSAPFSITQINDDTLEIDRVVRILGADPYVDFSDYRVSSRHGALVISGDGKEREIPYTNAPQVEIPWIGQPDVVFECSGKSTERERCEPYLTGRTRLVQISATSWDADATLVYGYNHEAFEPERHQVVSYGSCTVNGYVPLASFFHEQFGVRDSDVNVVHNIVLHRLAEHRTLLRKFCTLERSGPRLLPFLDDSKNFIVTYTVVPWAGVSMIDFRFRLERPVAREALIETLRQATKEGPLAGLYAVEDEDRGPQAHNCTPYSAVFIADGIKVRGDNVYLQAYFDTENSVNRYFDLAGYIAGRL